MIVKKAEYIKDYKIKLLFSDGVSKIVDFKPLLTGTGKLVQSLLDSDYFKEFFVDEITICWPNGYDFCPDTLYEIGKEVRGKTAPMKRPLGLKSQIKRKPAVAMSKKKNKNE